MLGMTRRGWEATNHDSRVTNHGFLNRNATVIPAVALVFLYFYSPYKRMRRGLSRFFRPNGVAFRVALGF